MGLPSSGKTTLAEKLVEKLRSKSVSVTWFNADEIRNQYNDWDFSFEGRIRQSKRMANLAMESNSEYVICDFVAPLKEMRYHFNADYIIWVDTIKSSLYQDTDAVFEPPKFYDVRVTEKDCELWADHVLYDLLGDWTSGYE